MALLTSEFLARLDGLTLETRRVLSARFRGERRSRRRGRSVEFADHREYAFGDDIRFLDWHLLGRLDRLFLKLFHDEEELRVYVILDASRSMAFGTPTKFDHARRVAASLAYVGLATMNRVKLLALKASGPRELPWQRGAQNASRMFDFLESLNPAGKNALASGLARWLTEARPSGLVILLSDLLDRRGAVPILRPLVRSTLDTWLVQVLSPQELDPDLTGDFRLVDSEEQDGVDVTATNSLLDSYRKALEKYLGDIAAYSRSRGLGHVLVSTDVPFEDFVLRALREEGMLR